MHETLLPGYFREDMGEGSVLGKPHRALLGYTSKASVVGSILIEPLPDPQGDCVRMLIIVCLCFLGVRSNPRPHYKTRE